MVGMCVVAYAPYAYSFSWESVLEFFSTLQDEASAWAVEVKQTALAANQEAQGYVAANQQLATAMGAIAMSDRAMKSIVDYDPITGQPDSIKCWAQQYGKLHVEAISQSSKDGRHLIAYYASERVLSGKTAMDMVVNTHKTNYCTISEAKQNMCKLTPNGMQGWDANYAGPFSEKTLAPEGELAAYDYAAMLTGRRNDAQADCTTIACSAAQAKQLAVSSIAVMAANSLVEQATARRVPMLTGK